MTPLDPAVAPVPPARRRKSFPERLYAFLVSPRLAIALLVGVLACCVVGVTVLRDERAWTLVFSTLWFNGLLVLLAISSGAAFFTRIWKRRLTVVSGGLILFHLSFLALLGGVVYHSLFHFKGVMRLSEGETLANGKAESYDAVEAGRFFGFDRLRGETTLVKMHRDYKVSGDNKRAAYEIAVGEGEGKKSSIIYVTEYLDTGGLRYFCLKEGYTVLVIMSDQQGHELYGAFVPLQSIMQQGGGHMYSTGSPMAPAPFPFPQPPEHPRVQLQVTYWPAVVERTGQIEFKVSPPEGANAPGAERKGLVQVGARFDAGDLAFVPREIRYWVGMDLRYDPGLPVIMGSLGFGLLGMVLTLVGRLRQGAAKRAAA